MKANESRNGSSPGAGGAVALLLTAAIAGLAVPAWGQESAGYGAAVGDLAPPVVVTDLEGQPVDLGALFGNRPVFLKFWATWCERCEALMPAVREAFDRYGGRVEFFGINVAVNQPKNRVKRYLADEKPPYRALYDQAGVSQRAFRVPTTSYVVIIDGAGRIAYTGLGGDQDFGPALMRVTSTMDNDDGSESGS